MSKKIDGDDIIEPMTSKGRSEAFDMYLAMTGPEMVERPITPKTYSLDYMLETPQQNCIVAYKVAKKLGIPLAKAINMYQVTPAPLTSIAGSGEQQQIDAINFACLNTIVDHPTVVMVNYKVGLFGFGGAHWAPIVVSKDESGNFTVTQINSATNPIYQRGGIEQFQANLVDILERKIDQEYNKAQENKHNLSQNKPRVTSQNASRNVQISNVCGFASSDAVANALQATKEGKGISDVILADSDQQLKIHSKTARNAAYQAQGAISIAVLDYLRELEPDARTTALAQPIFDLEKAAVKTAGLLSEKQVTQIKNSEDLEAVLTWKTDMSKEVLKSPVKLNAEEQEALYTEIISENYKKNGDKFNAHDAKTYMTDHLLALKMQQKEFSRVGTVAQTLEAIKEAIQHFLDPSAHRNDRSNRIVPLKTPPVATPPRNSIDKV